ncbi:Pseudouridine synthase [Hondaea fermentalgiana]|uniref:Pseudouridine synthase n=1 Tax=Hondaea fermentalgiana TaxID=2315210 RepID=A0A2R5GD61_9STRA|nr:Pseudouridine synthase [Hondaea fermentalgiana]|eukprot:GBG26553.1 Pseudouridine synthase [Hondaea fermentalgiana]
MLSSWRVAGARAFCNGPAPGRSGIRVNSWLAQHGICSRREADDLIARGLVTVNGETVALGALVPTAEDGQEQAVVRVDPQGQEELNAKRTFLIHKPIGIVSGQPDNSSEIPAVRLLEDLDRCAAPADIVEALRREPNYLAGVAPCGRLDKDSTGLLVLTQSGLVASKLLSREIEKEYLVRVAPKERITNNSLDRLQNGHLKLDGRAVWPCTVMRTDVPNVLRFILHEGRKRQIRRMCGLVGLDVTGLARVRVGKVDLDLKRGQWRTLRPDESFF